MTGQQRTLRIRAESLASNRREQAVHTSSCSTGFRTSCPTASTGQLQADKSYLLDAYKRNELVAGHRPGILHAELDSRRPGRAERVAEGDHGLVHRARATRTVCSPRQLDTFRMAAPSSRETDVRGERGAYLVECEIRA